MIPKPNNIPKPPTGELNADESQFIMESTLKPAHFRDDKIIEFIDAFIQSKSIPQASADCGIHKSVGYKWRHKSDIANCISKLIAKSAVKHGFDASEILERTKEMVDVDPIHIQNRDGSFKSNLHDIPGEIRRAIKKLKVKNLWDTVEDLNGMKKKIVIGEIIDYEFYDKIKAVELVGREKEMFKTTTKVEHGVTKDMAQILLDSSRRAEKMMIEEDKNNIIEAEVVSKKENDDE